jgi:hypothetical protein
MAQELLTSIGERHAAGMADEQHHTYFVFQIVDATADR